MGRTLNFLLLAALTSSAVCSAAAAPETSKGAHPTGHSGSATTKKTSAASNKSGPIKTATADGKMPVWLNLKDGLKAAKASGKYIVVDVFTDWCHYCHKLDKEVFSVPPVGPYLAENFVCIRLNAEDHGEGQAFSNKLNVRGFPTSIFMDSSGGALQIVPGFAPAEPYLKKLEEIQAMKVKGVKGEKVL